MSSAAGYGGGDASRRARVTISTGAKLLLRQRDTIIPALSLAPSATGTAGGGPSMGRASESMMRSSNYSSSPNNAAAAVANARLLDRFDVGSVATGSLYIQAPTRILPTPKASNGKAVQAPTKGPDPKANQKDDGKSSKSTAPSASKTTGPAKSSKAAPSLNEPDLISSVSAYRFPPEAASPSSPSGASASGGGKSLSVPTSAKLPPSGASGDPFSLSANNNGTGKQPPHASPPLPLANAPAKPWRTLDVSPIMEAGSAIVWVTYPTSFSMFLVDDGTGGDLALDAYGSPANMDSMYPPASPPSRSPADRPADLPHSVVPTTRPGGPSPGIGAVQLLAINFASRCTATTTFTTHRWWRVACGVHDRASTARARRAQRSMSRADPPDLASNHDHQTPLRRQGSSTVALLPGGSVATNGHLSAGANNALDNSGSADFSPAAAAEMSDPRCKTPPPPQQPQRSNNSSSTTTNERPRPVPLLNPTSANNNNPLEPSSFPPADLWSVFGFVNGDIVIWSHATQSVLKRHNSCKLGTRAVANAAVSAICRVEREGSDEGLPSMTVGEPPSLYDIAASECSCSEDGGPVDHAGRRHNPITCVFGDLVVGFDNGTILVVRLNKTGGFIDDERGAWLGFTSINVLKPCPTFPRVLSAACGDGVVRFLHFPTSFIVKPTAPGAAPAQNNNGPLSHDSAAAESFAPEEVGTCSDPRLLAVTPLLAVHGGVLALDWLADGSGIVAGCQDDSITLIALNIDTALTPARLRATSFAGTGTYSEMGTPLPVPRIDDVSSSAAAVRAAARSRNPPPVYVDIRGTVRRTYHRAWIRDVIVVPIQTEVPMMKGEPPSPASVASYENVNVGGVRDTPAPMELSHLAICASEDGQVSIWHLPSRDQIQTLTHTTASGATPSRPLVSNASFGLSKPMSNSFVPAMSRPLAAMTPPPANRGGNGALERTPSVYLTNASTNFAGGLTSGYIPSASLGRQPAGVLPRLTRVVGPPPGSSGTSGRMQPMETVLDDTILAMALLPPIDATWGPALISRLAGPGAGGGNSPSARSPEHSAVPGMTGLLVTGPSEIPTLFFAVSAKGSCFLWSVEPNE
jgi:hypothetical protein